MDQSTVYVFYERPVLDWRDWPSTLLPLYDPDLTGFKVRFSARDLTARPYVTVFGLDGGGRDETASRRAVDWRLNWYRDPDSAWWEQ